MLLKRLGINKSNLVALLILARTVLKLTEDDLLKGDDIIVY